MGQHPPRRDPPTPGHPLLTDPPGPSGHSALLHLARLYGIQPSYRAIDGQTHRSPPDAILAVLRALGAELHDTAGVEEALRVRRLQLQRRAIAPVTVVWEGIPTSVILRLPATGTLRCHMQTEDGNSREWDGPVEMQRDHKLGGTRYRSVRLPLPGDLPLGYHSLTIDSPAGVLRTRVIVAPIQATPGRPVALSQRRTWGLFLPLYALRTQGGWGAGDFGGLRRLGEWSSSLGGGVAATLPLLAAFLDQPFEPSPYAPVSRLAWNEFYIDVTHLPEFPQVAGTLAPPSELPHVDYKGVMAGKRKVLEAMVARMPAAHRHDMQVFLESHPTIADYARFRATTETRAATWPTWPERLRAGDLNDRDYEPEKALYHQYVQWLAQEQLRETVTVLERRGTSLYLDLPLGVNGDGYDVWRYRQSFAQGVSGGAPPDTLFTGGQDWGFPPLHPERTSEDGHSYLIACLRHHLEMSRMLRIDHVMGLHRLYWVPHGMSAKDGVYVRYPTEELYAILCLEARRHDAIIVGENLGTVPLRVNLAMEQHDIKKMYVLQYEVNPHSGLRSPAGSEVASMNTHDMPTFGGFWEGRDVQDQHDLGLIDQDGLHEALQARASTRQVLVQALKDRGLLTGAQDPGAVLAAALKFLAVGESPLLLVNLEDLWLEPDPQNTPGTWHERPNWLRTSRYTLEQFRERPEITRLLSAVDEARRKGAGPGS